MTLETALTLEEGADFSDDGHSSSPQVLSNGHLLKEDGNSTEEHGDEVDDEENPATILVAQVGKSPHIYTLKRSRRRRSNTQVSNLLLTQSLRSSHHFYSLQL